MICYMPDATVTLSPLIAQEAVSSSKIEGSQSTLDDVYTIEEGEQDTALQTRDLHEIRNYLEALRYGSKCLAERGITL